MVSEQNTINESNKFKESLRSLLFGNKDLVSILMPDLEDSDFTEEQNWYGGTYTLLGPDGTEIKTASLPGHCLDVPFVNTTTDKIAQVLIETSITRTNKRLLEHTFHIFVVSHKDIIALDSKTQKMLEQKGYAGNRVDMGIAAVHDSISKNVTMPFGIGEIQLSDKTPIQSFYPDELHYGKQLTYICNGFHHINRN